MRKSCIFDLFGENFPAIFPEFFPHEPPNASHKAFSSFLIDVRTSGLGSSVLFFFFRFVGQVFNLTFDISPNPPKSSFDLFLTYFNVFGFRGLFKEVFLFLMPATKLLLTPTMTHADIAQGSPPTPFKF